jgi:hypothetical protein
MRLNKQELLTITGGTVNASLINAVVKGMSILIGLGKSLGSIIRRMSENKTCKL